MSGAEKDRNDPRSRIEIIQDNVDMEFSDFYHELGLWELDEGRQFSKDELLTFVRVALVRGVRQQGEDTETIKRINDSIRNETGESSGETRNA